MLRRFFSFQATIARFCTFELEWFGRGRFLYTASTRLLRPVGLLAQRTKCGARDQSELNPTGLKIDARDLNLHRISETITHSGALASQFVQGFVKLKIFCA